LTLHLLRHASVEDGYIGRYNGHIDIALSENGKKEAVLAAQKLDGVCFDAVYCSDLLRCRQSVEPFGFSSVIYDARLREKSWGRAEGMSFGEICDKFGIVYEDFESFVRSVGGEGLDEFAARIDGFFEQLRLSDASSVLVVTHGGVIRTLLAKLRGLSLEEAFCIDAPYASITIVEDFV